jgi:hypothetical protein
MNKLGVLVSFVGHPGVSFSVVPLPFRRRAYQG